MQEENYQGTVQQQAEQDSTKEYEKMYRDYYKSLPSIYASMLPQIFLLFLAIIAALVIGILLILFVNMFVGMAAMFIIIIGATIFLVPKMQAKATSSALRNPRLSKMMVRMQSTPEMREMQVKLVNEQMKSPAYREMKEQMKREIMQEMAGGQAQQGNYSGTSGTTENKSTDVVFEEELQKKIREMKEGV